MNSRLKLKYWSNLLSCWTRLNWNNLLSCWTRLNWSSLLLCWTKLNKNNLLSCWTRLNWNNLLSCWTKRDAIIRRKIKQNEIEIEIDYLMKTRLNWCQKTKLNAINDIL